MPSVTADRPAPALLRVCERPRVSLIPDFIDADTAAALARLVADDAALAALGVVAHADETGRTATIDAASDPLLSALFARICAAVGLPEQPDQTLQLHHQRAGDSYPARLDHSAHDGQGNPLGTSRLVAAALVWVAAPTAGGQTVFLHAVDAPLAIAPCTGQLMVWRTVEPDGELDVLAEHRGVAIREGEAVSLTVLCYADASAAAAATADERAPQDMRAAVRPRGPLGELRGFGRALAVIDDGVPAETVDLIEAAADARGIRVLRIDPRRFDFAPDRRLRPGDMIYRPAISMHSARVEQHLWTDQVGSFYLDPDGPFFSNINAMATFSRAGLPVPRTFWLTNGDRDLLRSYVDQLGGLPIVVKALGYSRGVGTIRADSLASLFSIVDYALVGGGRPLLTSYVLGFRVASGHDRIFRRTTQLSA